MIVDLICDKTYQLEFIEPTTPNELQQMYQMRYQIYKKRGYIEQNGLGIDKDHFDEGGRSVYFVAKYKDVILGSVRVITGDTIPTFDCYYKLSLPDKLQNIPREKIYEVGRIVSCPYGHEIPIPRHFIILMLLYTVLDYSLKHDGKMVVGTIKKYAYEKLKLINLPIYEINDRESVYNPAEYGDPLIHFFNQKKTGEILPIYILQESAINFYAPLLNNFFISKKLACDHFEIRHTRLFHSLLLINSFRLSLTKALSKIFNKCPWKRL